MNTSGCTEKCHHAPPNLLLLCVFDHKLSAAHAAVFLSCYIMEPVGSMVMCSDVTFKHILLKGLTMIFAGQENHLSSSEARKYTYMSKQITKSP